MIIFPKIILFQVLLSQSVTWHADEKLFEKVLVFSSSEMFQFLKISLKNAEFSSGVPGHSRFPAAPEEHGIRGF